MKFPCKLMKDKGLKSYKTQLNSISYTCQDAQHPMEFGLSILRQF